MTQTFLEIPIDGQTLAACLHRPTQDATAGTVPIVICCHGLTGSRIGACYRQVTLGRRLAVANVACLRFDFRGCGESDGRFQDVTAQTLIEDLRAVTAAAAAIPGCDASRIGLVGSSFGAYTASHAACAIDGLRCLVFWAPVADVQSLAEQQMTAEAWVLLRKQGWVEHHGLRLGAGFFDEIPADDAPERLAAAGRPVLIYHGVGDQQVPIEHGRRYEAACRKAGVDVQFEPIEANDHAMRSVALNEKILDGTVAWLLRFLSAG